MRFILKIVLGPLSVVCIWLAAIDKVEAATYTFVDSWRVDQVLFSQTGLFPFTGQEAAAYLFGGSPNDYVISTAGPSVGDIDFSNWVTVWGAGSAVNGDCASGFPCGKIVAQDFKTDNGVINIYDRLFIEGGFVGDTSALGADWALGSQFTNYAFAVSPVPLPAALPLFLTVLAGMGALRSWRRRVA